MARQLRCGAAICVFLSFCALAKSVVTEGDTITMQNKLHEGIFMLKEGIEILQGDVEVLNKKSTSQIKLLKEMQSEADDQKADDGICGQISGFFNSTYRKYNVFEERIITKLEEVQDEQTSNLNKILVKLNLSKNCQQGSGLDIMSEALSEINGKIDKFETQVKSFETLEEKLKQEQTRVQSVNDEQMKILKEISAKLSLHQQKFEQFEKQLPSLMEVTKGVTAMATEKKHKLPLEFILGLTNDKTAPKA